MPYILNKHYPARNLFFFLGEGCLIFGSINCVYLFFKGPILYAEDFAMYGFRALLVTFIFQLSLYFFDLYDLKDQLPPTETIARTTQAFGVGCIILAAVYVLFPAIIISSKVFWVGYIAISVSIFGWRFLYNYMLDKRLFSQSILILGAGYMASEIAGEIRARRDSGYKIAGFVGEGNPACSFFKEIPFFPKPEKLMGLCKEHNVQRIVVALDDRRGSTPVKDLLSCKLAGIPIEDGISFYEGLTGKIIVEKVNPAWIIFAEGFKKGRIVAFGKRAIDVFCAVLGLLVFLPVILISALIIKLESPGGIFYFQERVGEKGKVFNVIKFRSMGADAEKDGPVWAMKNDMRVTRFGAFIRKARIDEIPQMWNVLKGEMSFVGPRPERPVFIEQLSEKIPYYSLRHSVKPGITGWAQICYPYGASEEDALRKLEYDLYYIKNMTFQMDLWIIFQTIKTVLFQKGSR
jgi:sugar transferase (PEP-CTERM system associated)